MNDYNRLTKSDSVDGPASYTYDENDRLLTQNSTVYTYDNNGNTIGKTEGSTNVTTYGYDYENRLVAAQTPTALIHYAYDVDGIRVISNVNDTMTSYLIDKNRDYAQIIEERDGGSALIASYVYGDDLISMDRGAIVSFYHYDGNGNTRQLTDLSEDMTDTYTYDAFGILLNKTGVTINNYLYTGEQYDANVRFYYLRARYYNSDMGRFMTYDLDDGDFAKPITLHKYLYAQNNPVMMIDPSGEFSIVSISVGLSILSVLVMISKPSYSEKAVYVNSIIYNKSSGVITWNHYGLVALAVTGGKIIKKGKIIKDYPAIPSGKYAAWEGDIGDDAHYRNKPSFQDITGFGWFLWLHSEKDKSFDNREIGIHPDGGEPHATQACIGIYTYDWLSMEYPNEKMGDILVIADYGIMLLKLI